MAVLGEEKEVVQEKSFEANAKAAAPQQQPNAFEDQMGSSRARPISDLMEPWTTTSTLEGAGKEYLQKVKENLAEKLPGSVSLMVNTESIVCCIFMDKDKTVGVPVLFAETNRSIEDIPPVEHMPAIIKRFKAAIASEATLLQSIVIAEEDYSRSSNMANHIAMQIGVNVSHEVLTVENFRSSNFVCTTDVSKVKKFIDDYSPHAIPARCDIGLLLSAVVKKDPRLLAPGENEWREIPLMAISAYTSFSKNINNNQFGNYNSSFSNEKDIIPCVNISDIVVNRAYKEFISIAIPLAAHQFIRTNGWLSAYNNYSITSQNLGNLLIDKESGKPAFTATQADRDDIIQRFIQMPPYMAVDIADGRARISGLDNYGNTEKLYEVIADMQRFLNVEQLGVSQNPIIDKIKTYEGYVKNKEGQLVDSRCIDYLYLCQSNVSLDIAGRFLFQPRDPLKRSKDVAQIHPEHKTLYSTTKVALHSAFVSTIGAQLEHALKIRFDNAAPDFGNGFLNAVSQGANNFNNFNMGYTRQSSPFNANIYM